MLISRSQLVDKIRKTKKFFTVTFNKRSDGKKRIMNCRNGVKCHLAGGKPAFNPEDKELISTYSLDSKGYRSIPIEGLIGASIEGTTYIVKD